MSEVIAENWRGETAELIRNTQSANRPNVWAFSVILSSACVSYRRSAQTFWMEAECSSWWVHSLPVFPLQFIQFIEWQWILIWIFSGGQLHVHEGMRYLHSAVRVMSFAVGSLPWSLSHQLGFKGGRGGGEPEVQLHSDTFNWINWLQFLHFTCRNPSVTL